MHKLIVAVFTSILFTSTICAQSDTQPDAVLPTEQWSTSSGKEWIAQYFRQETERLTAQTFSEIETLDDWTKRKPEYRRQLLEMLGLDPMPRESALQAKITGTLEQSDVIVERLHFQSMPGLYVTANLYRPKEQSEPLPAILYVCGHGREKVDGISVGNKTHYQHHGAWFARNGYVCLMIDTIQLGEIEGVHHGTYRHGMWWWNNRGYTPAGVEAYNCIRSLDYLESRQEVDADRIGVTGRSGGGAYSWWIAAIDERVAAAVPVAGITSLTNHVVDGCVEGHCDCMYMVNTYRWDFPMVAALVAPRPVLISNTDQDRIFPLDGVVDLHAKTREIYSLYEAEDKLGLHITQGPHSDTQELRMGAFRWLNRYLRDNDELIETAAKPLFSKRDLKVFDQLPKDQRVETIQESFVPVVGQGSLPLQSEDAFNEILDQLREKTFRGWPEVPEELNVHVVKETESKRAKLIEFDSQTPFRLPIYLFQGDSGADDPVHVTVLDRQAWNRWAPVFAAYFPNEFPSVQPDPKRTVDFQRLLSEGARAFVVPRGVGPSDWGGDLRYQTHLRRRFMLLGQTLAGMQIYDVRLAMEALISSPSVHARKIVVAADGEAAFWITYASLFVDGIDEMKLTNLPDSNRDAPDLLNVSRVIEFKDLRRLAEQKLERTQ